MSTKTGTLGDIASKTLAAGRKHIAKVLTGEETVAQAAGGTVEDLLSDPKAKSSKPVSVGKTSRGQTSERTGLPKKQATAGKKTTKRRSTRSKKK